MAELRTGEYFAQRYVIQRLLGEGDRKKTYLAKDTKLDRLVALSFVKPGAAIADPEGTEREAKVLGRIGSHANIVSLYDYETSPDGTAQYMVFQYLGGGTLTAYLREAGPLPMDALLRLGRQLCRGLAHLHSAGLVHRDVSPDNVWLDERQVAHLGDFDSAITAGSQAGLLPVTTGSFASPEEHEGRALDLRTDLYSLGMLLHVAATGERYPGGPDLLLRRTDLPSSFADLVAALLAELPADRPADATAVLEALDMVRRASNVKALLAAGESESVEFKSSLHHAHGAFPEDLRQQVEQRAISSTGAQKELKKRLNKEVTKTIAAFLNSHGGILLIGVDDSGAAVGVEPDFKHVQQDKPNADGWLLSLRDVVGKALGADAWEVIHVSLVRHEGALVAILDCPRRQSETWHHEGTVERFYVRAANATQELSGPGLVRHIREHWPA